MHFLKKWKRQALLKSLWDLAHRSDIFRMLVLYNHGGLYFDLDILFLRDFSDLFRFVSSAEFCYQWSGESYTNSAILKLEKHSPITKQLLEKSLRKMNFRPWKLFDFQDKDLDLLVLPSCFFDPLWLQNDGRDCWASAPFQSFVDFFASQNVKCSFRDFFAGAFTYHWHNQ